MPGGQRVGGSFGRGIGASIGRGVGVVGGLIAAGNRPVVVEDGGIDPDLQPPLRGSVRFITVERPRVSIDVRTFDEPTLPEAESGWDIVEIPQDIDLPVWRSGKPLRMIVPIIMDVLGLEGRNGIQLDIEDEWTRLVRLWRPPGGQEPPQLRVYGPVTFADRRWVISDLVENRALTKRVGRRLVRVQADVELLATRSTDLVEFAKPAADKKARKDRTRFVDSKEGDTLKKIAKRELGNGRKANDLLKLNPGVGSVNRTIRANTEIRIK